jgi:hypothetical protein
MSRTLDRSPLWISGDTVGATALVTDVHNPDCSTVELESMFGGYLDPPLDTVPAVAADRRSLRRDERAIFELWRTAVGDADVFAVGDLVRQAHAIRDALRSAPPPPLSGDR